MFLLSVGLWSAVIVLVYINIKKFLMYIIFQCENNFLINNFYVLGIFHNWVYLLSIITTELIASFYLVCGSVLMISETILNSILVVLTNRNKNIYIL